jgi:hypothetical protein
MMMTSVINLSLRNGPNPTSIAEAIANKAIRTKGMILPLQTKALLPTAMLNVEISIAYGR